MNNKSLEVVNNACQSMVSPVWSVKNEWSVKPLGIGCKTRVKFTIGHWSVSIHLLLVVRSPFVSFVFVFDKSFVRHLYLLTPVKRLFNLLQVSVPAFQSQSLNSSYSKFSLKRLS